MGVRAGQPEPDASGPDRCEVAGYGSPPTLATGPNRGTRFNDDDGSFGPPVSGPLPSTSTSALLFDGSAADKSSSNVQDYVVTGGVGGGPTVFTNSTGATFVVTQ